MFRVEMRNERPDDTGRLWVFEAVDHVSEDALDAYVSDAKTRWDSVETFQEN